MSIPADFTQEECPPGPIGIDDEMILIRVPKAFDISRLDGQRFSRHHVTEVGRDDGPGDLHTVYSSTFYKNQAINVQPLVSSQGKLCLGNSVKGLVSVTKSFELKSSGGPSKSLLMGSSGVVMPSGLKPRFTPFGSGNPVKSLPQSPKRKQVDDLIDCPVFDKKKKKKKRKSSDVETPTKKQQSTACEVDVKQEINYDSDIFITQRDTPIPTPKSSKKKRKNLSLKKESGAELDSVSECLENGHNDRKPAGQLNGDVVNGDVAESHVEEIDSDHQVKKIKTETHRKEILSKTMVSDLDFSLLDDINSGSVKKKKKKKDKRKDMSLQW